MKTIASLVLAFACALCEAEVLPLASLGCSINPPAEWVLAPSLNTGEARLLPSGSKGEIPSIVIRKIDAAVSLEELLEKTEIEILNQEGCRIQSTRYLKTLSGLRLGRLSVLHDQDNHRVRRIYYIVASESAGYRIIASAQNGSLDALFDEAAISFSVE